MISLETQEQVEIFIFCTDCSENSITSQCDPNKQTWDGPFTNPSRKMTKRNYNDISLSIIIQFCIEIEDTRTVNP